MTRHELCLRAFPADWRRRYGAELLALVDDEGRDGLRSRSVELVIAGLRERLHRAQPGLVIRAGALVAVACAVVALAPAVLGSGTRSTTVALVPSVPTAPTVPDRRRPLGQPNAPAIVRTRPAVPLRRVAAPTVIPKRATMLRRSLRATEVRPEPVRPADRGPIVSPRAVVPVPGGAAVVIGASTPAGGPAPTPSPAGTPTDGLPS